MKYLLGFLLIFSTNLFAKDILAIVNGNEISTDVAHSDYNTMSDEQKEIAVKRLIEKELAIEYALNDDIVKEKKFVETYKHVLEKMSPKNEAIDLASAVKEQNIKLTDEQVRSKKGLLAFDMILDKKAASTKPDEKTLKNYYESNKDRYNDQKMYELFQIVVNTEAEANAIVDELSKAPSVTSKFRELATTKSVAPSKEEGGYIGQFVYNDMQDEMKKALDGLQRSQYTKPFKTDFGYQVLLVMGFQDEVIRGYKESQINVKQDYIRETTINWAFEQINKLKEKANIKMVFKG